MRRSHFRLWDIENNRMLYHDKNIVPDMTINGVLFTDNQGNVSHKFKMMQSTGIELGMYCKEIFEGDIVKIDGKIGVIEFSEKLCGFTFNDEPLGNYNVPFAIEVIGNVFETPELLKAEVAEAEAERLKEREQGCQGF